MASPHADHSVLSPQKTLRLVVWEILPMVLLLVTLAKNKAVEKRLFRSHHIFFVLRPTSPHACALILVGVRVSVGVSVYVRIRISVNVTVIITG